MGNAASAPPARRRNQKTWSIPLNRTKIPVLATTRKKKNPRKMYRRPSLRTWNNNNNNNNTPPTWADVRHYLVHGPLPSSRRRS